MIYNDDSDTFHDGNGPSYTRCRSCGSKIENDDGDDMAVDTCGYCEADDR
jgi:hypothetical protein